MNFLYFNQQENQQWAHDCDATLARVIPFDDIVPQRRVAIQLIAKL